MKTLVPAFESFQSTLLDGGTLIGVDVDTQSDFVDESGALYVPAPPAVRQNLAQLTQRIPNRIGSVDSHAFDAWEFVGNGGPFPDHCVKGEAGWLRIPETRLDAQGRVLPTRFVPMSEGPLVVGESVAGAGNRGYGPDTFAQEVLSGKAGLFEKEVYSAFANPLAEAYIDRLVEAAGGVRKAVFAVYGYCTGGYCVDAFAEGLAQRGYQTALVSDAVAPINFAPEDGSEQDGNARTQAMCQAKGIAELTTAQVLRLVA